jgi:hypothetical protein
MSREQNWENLTNPADRFLAILTGYLRSVIQGGPRVLAVGVGAGGVGFSL